MPDSPDAGALHERIIELESRVVFQDDIIEKLDGVVTDFTGRVEDLERQLLRLRGQLDQLSEAAAEIGPGDEPPPHY